MPRSFAQLLLADERTSTEAKSKPQDIYVTRQAWIISDMRLININTLTLEEYDSSSRAPKYCIASHKWRDEELTFEDVNLGVNKHKAGWTKLHGFCKAVKDLEIQNTKHIWIDTACIDKSSSVELSEAINSMYTYYLRSQACLAYLDDVPTAANSEATFRRSIWFKRGWTLQELLAPRVVVFLSAKWEIIGCKMGGEPPSDIWNSEVLYPFLHPSINQRVAEATGIRRVVLRQVYKLPDLSNAEKWKWLENRQTKKPEDMAYCMLGIFGVFMPLIYGEGERNARARLEEEVRKNRKPMQWMQNLMNNFVGLQ